MSDFGSGWAWIKDKGDSDAPLSYSFTIANGVVTTEDIVGRNGQTHTVDLSSIDSFTAGPGTVTETITLDAGTAAIDYAAESGSTTLYQVVGHSFTFTDPTGALPGGGTLTYGFTLINGAVTAATETISLGSDSITRTVHTPADAVFATGTGTVTESWVSGDHVKTITYTELQGGTNYVVSETSTSLILPGSATTILDVRPDQQAMFTINSSGAVTAAELVRPDGHTVALTPDSHYALTELATGYVEAVIGSGNHTHFAVYYDGAGSGTYTEIAHGSGSTVDLVGLKAQIAELPTALAAAV
jgi:hypothetical protein